MPLFFHGKCLCIIATAALLGCMPIHALAAPATAPVTTPTPPAAPTAPAAPIVTDDLVNAVPELSPEQPRPQIVQPEPGIDYSLPGSPTLPVLPGAKVINPVELYVLPPAGELPQSEDEDVKVVMPATPEMPMLNGTLLNGTLLKEAMVNGTIPVRGGNATIIPLASGFNNQGNATEPQANATITPLMSGLNTNATVPQTNTKQSMRVLTPADFLVKNTTQKPEPPKKETPIKAEQPKMADPQKPAPPKAPVLPKKPEPSKKPQRGEEMRIPPEAAKTGDMSFLEGCWKGTRPEYNTKRMVNERFCFDASGVGKRTITDPTYAGMCYGPTKALLNKDGVLRMSSGHASCTSGDVWAESSMVCEGEGENTPCRWVFGPKDSQSYKIRFVRE